MGIMGASDRCVEGHVAGINVAGGEAGEYEGSVYSRSYAFRNIAINVIRHKIAAEFRRFTPQPKKTMGHLSRNIQPNKSRGRGVY